jgi:PAS domain S-box-containing protein
MSNQLADHLLQTMIKKAAMGLILYDSEKKVVFCNDTILNMVGYAAGEIIGSNFFSIVVKDEKYLKVALLKLDSCYSKPFDDYDIQVTKKTGGTLFLHLAGSIIDDSGSIFALLIAQDITRKKAFEKVIESTYDNIMQSTIDLDAAMKKIKEQRQALEDYKAKIESELKVAKSVQKSIIPKIFFSNQNLSIWGVSLPSAELGGDYFDFFQPDDTKLGILVSDVSGHGVPSALITTMIKVYFEKYAMLYAESDLVFKSINSEVTKTLLETGFYFTAFYSIIDLDTMIVTSTSAGHDFAVCYNPRKDEVFQLGKTEKGTIIGSFEEAEYDSSIFQLEKGCKVAFFTDGITEARNKDGEFYGVERVIEVIKKNKTLTPKELVEIIINDTNDFSGGNIADDRTLVIVDILNVPTPDKMSKLEIEGIIDTAYKHGRDYIKKKQYHAALNEFLKIIKFDKNSSGAYSYLGQVFGVFGDFMKAEEYLKKSIELDPSYFQGYYFLGIILYKQKKYKEAKESWVKLKKLTGDFKNVDDYLEKIEKMGM